MKHCDICKRELDVRGKPTSDDCGGTCLECAAGVGDPDAEKSLIIAKRVESTTKHGTYIGPKAWLNGKEALIMELLPPHPDRIEAQFDDRALDANIAELDDCVAHGWRTYERKYFVLDEEGA